MPIRVMVADDHPLVRAGVHTALMTAEDIEVIGEAVNGYEVQKLIQQVQPDVLLLDINMPGPPANEIVSFVHAFYPEVKVLVLTAHADPGYVYPLLAAGVAGYLLKDEPIDVLVAAVQTVAHGGDWFSPAIVAHVTTGASLEAFLHSSPLTTRELEVLALVAQGWTNARIALKLGISERTVRFHMEQIFTRLRVDNRLTAVTLAQKRGWLQCMTE